MVEKSTTITGRALKDLTQTDSYRIRAAAVTSEDNIAQAIEIITSPRLSTDYPYTPAICQFLEASSQHTR